MFCSLRVEVREIDGRSVLNVVKETADWLQNYFSNGLSGNLPEICVLSDSELGKCLLCEI